MKKPAPEKPIAQLSREEEQRQRQIAEAARIEWASRSEHQPRDPEWEGMVRKFVDYAREEAGRLGTWEPRQHAELAKALLREVLAWMARFRTEYHAELHQREVTWRAPARVGEFALREEERARWLAKPITRGLLRHCLREARGTPRPQMQLGERV